MSTAETACWRREVWLVAEQCTFTAESLFRLKVKLHRDLLVGFEVKLLDPQKLIRMELVELLLDIVFCVAR